MLGTIALSGMIMRNSLILIDQIEQDRQAGIQRGKQLLMQQYVVSVRSFHCIGSSTRHDPSFAEYFLRSNGCCDYGRAHCCYLADIIFFLPALYAAWFKVKKQHKNT